MESSLSKHALQLALQGGVLAAKLGNHMRAVPHFLWCIGAVLLQVREIMAA